MSDHVRVADTIPEFDIALWGYDRLQVERCLYDLTGRLEDALGRLDSVEALHQQLCDVQVELDQLRLSLEQQPHWTYQLAEIMQTAEALRGQAEQAAGGSQPG